MFVFLYLCKHSPVLRSTNPIGVPDESHPVYGNCDISTNNEFALLIRAIAEANCVSILYCKRFCSESNEAARWLYGRRDSLSAMSVHDTVAELDERRHRPADLKSLFFVHTQYMNLVYQQINYDLRNKNVVA